MGRVYGWAKARVCLTQTQRQCGFELGLGLELRLMLGLGLGLGCSDITDMVLGKPLGRGGGLG